MKTSTSVTLDVDLVAKSKKLNINISQLINRVLKGVISQYHNSDIDIFKLEADLEQIRNKICTLKIEEQELLSQKISYEEKKKQNNEKQIKDLVKKAEFIKRSGVLTDGDF